MTGIMIFHIRSKYTAVGTFLCVDLKALRPYSEPGRKEILMFFYLYAIIELLGIFLDADLLVRIFVSLSPRFGPWCSRQSS